MKKIALAILGAVTLTSGLAFAGYKFTASTDAVGCYEDGTCYVILTSNVPSAGPQCSTGNQIRFMLTTTGGEEMHRMAVAAHLAGQPIRVEVNTSCVTWSDGTQAAKATRLSVE